MQTTRNCIKLLLIDVRNIKRFSKILFDILKLRIFIKLLNVHRFKEPENKLKIILDNYYHYYQVLST